MWIPRASFLSPLIMVPVDCSSLHFLPLSDARARPRFSIRTWGAVSSPNGVLWRHKKRRRNSMAPVIVKTVHAHLVVRYSETKTENLVRSLKFQFEPRLELFQWKLKSVLAGNFGVRFPFQVSNSRSQDLRNTHTQSSKLQHKASNSNFWFVFTHEPFWL